MINDSKNQDAAILFLNYLLNPKNGLKVLGYMGQPPFVPCRVSSEQVKNLIPSQIRKWVEVRN